LVVLLSGACSQSSPGIVQRKLAAASPATQRPRVACNRAVAELIGAHAVADAAPVGYGLSGRGVQVGVWDEGVARTSHLDLRGRVRAVDLGGFNEHATHTTATLAGAGVAMAEARGMAPEARVWAYDWALDFAELEAAAPWLSVSSHAYGLRLGWSVSAECPELPMWWGGQGEARDPAFGRYNKDAATADAVAFRTDLLSIWPAGNERLDTGAAPGAPHYHAGSCSGRFDDAHAQELTLQYGTIGGPATAKNVLTIGAANNVLRAELNAARIVAMDMSSFGPTDDGRIKPELVAGGELVPSASARADDQYLTLSGSSSATAATAGVLALLTELYRKTHAGADPTAAELKALLVHGARAAGAAGPDFGTGYGLVDAQAAADLLEADAARAQGERQLRSAAIAAGETLTLATTVEVAAGTALRATLAWTDPPATPSTGATDDARPVLVNDLDLTLVAPDGSAFYPWRLDGARPEAAATRSAHNRVDNLEVVDVGAKENRSAGRWSLRIAAPASLWRDRAQAFALVASVPFEAAARAPLELPRYLTIDLDAGETPPALRVPLADRGGSSSITAHSLTPWLAVTPGSTSAAAELMLEIDAAALDVSGEFLGRVAIDGDEATGPRTLGVLARVRCVPDCAGRSCGPDPRCGESCGDCNGGDYCSDGKCASYAAGCPEVELGSELGLSLLAGSDGAGQDVESGSCGGAQRRELGVSWTAPEAGRFAFTTRGSELDTVLYARDGICAGSELACNDDSGSVASAVALDLQAGQQLSVFVDGLDSGAGGAFALNVERAACPSVDLGSRMGQAVVQASTFGDIDMLAGSCGGRGAEDVTLRFEAPATARYRFALFEPRFQAVLYARDGGCDGHELGCSAAADVGPLELALDAGQVVVLVVDGREGKSGEFALDITDVAGSCAARCGAAGSAFACACDDACVAAGDCCADACAQCGACRCQRSCAGRTCGDDGCAGSCGECDPGELCTAGKCVADACAGVTCEPCQRCDQGRCLPQPDGAACEDGDLCTVLDQCSGGSCIGQPRGCDDGYACTRDRCDPSSGACQHTPLGHCCEAGRACPDAGGCEPGASNCVASLGDAGVQQRDAGTPGARGPQQSRASGCGCETAGAARRSDRKVWMILMLIASARSARRRRSSIAASPLTHAR
jgi:hypothetical protein